jgi:hypothetical protein
MATIDVSCSLTDGGWSCSVVVGEGGSTTRHVVAVALEDLRRLAPAASAEDLVRRSFAFLLEREPKESILRSFSLAVIGRYFPEYERTIRGGAKIDGGG